MKLLNLLAATSALAQLEETIVAAGSARPVRANKPQTSFDKVMIVEVYLCPSPVFNLATLTVIVNFKKLN